MLTREQITELLDAIDALLSPAGATNEARVRYRELVQHHRHRLRIAAIRARMAGSRAATTKRIRDIAEERGLKRDTPPEIVADHLEESGDYPGTAEGIRRRAQRSKK